MATANNIPSQEEASHPHIREESGGGRLFRRRHIGTAGEALQPSAISLDEESQDWKGADAKQGKRTDGGGLPILDLGLLDLSRYSASGPTANQDRRPS